MATANPQMPCTKSLSPACHIDKVKAKAKELDLLGLTNEGVPSWDDLRGMPHFNIGIVVNSSSTIDRHLSSIAKPATPCSLHSVVILHSEVDEDKDAAVEDWFRTNRVRSAPSSVNCQWGQEGFKQLLSSDVDAIYIIVPPGSQRDYVLEALKAGKHVLLNDPVSTSMGEFIEQQTVAKKYGKFIQFTTMFVYQFQVLRFIDKVLGDEKFGTVRNMDASLHVSYHDVEKVGVKLPLNKEDGSIKVLGRFCVLLATLFHSQIGSFAESAKVDKAEFDGNCMTSAVFTVKFEGGRVLTAHVGYTHRATRQSIKLDASTRFATMNDFVIEHPDGLATYRVYEKAPKIKDIEVTQGEAIDLAGGPPQDTMMWRTFVDLCRTLDKQGGWDQSEQTRECRVLANVALQTKCILMALMKSVENSMEEVVIDDIDYQ